MTKVIENNFEEKLAIIFKDEVVSYLNSNLIEKQKISDKTIETLKELHVKKLEVFEEMKASSDKRILRQLAKKVTILEFLLQKHWKFDLNENYHYWCQVPHCQCPKMDNRDLYGTPYKIINQNCIIHGK